MTGNLRLAAMLNGKMTPNSGNSRKNRPGLKPEHTEANMENSLGRLAVTELDKRMAPPAPTMPTAVDRDT